MFLINPYILQASGNPLWNDLLAYYTADNTPNDALGTYNGTLTNGATYGTGIINQGFSFDGVNDYVDLGDVLDNDGTQAQSVSFWVNLNSTSTQAFVSKIDQGTPFNGWSVGTVNNKINYIFANNITTGVYVQVENSTVITTGTWYHVVATYDGSKSASGVKVYIDGSIGTQNILKDTLSTNSTSSTGVKATISSRDGGFLFTNGIIDEVGIWNRELSASEVTELYNSGSGLQYPTGILPLWNDLLAYYTADNTPNDALGNYNGTLTNGATYGTGIINQGFSFDGVNDYVDFGNNLDFDGSTPFSISCWVNSNDVTSFKAIVGKVSTTPTGYYIATFNGKVRFYASNNGSTNWLSIENSGTVTTSSFFHVVVTYDGSKSVAGTKLYVNNALNTQTLVSDTLTASISNSASFTVSSRNGASLFYDGIVDEVGIWDRELTASEVTELYNSGSGLQY